MLLTKGPGARAFTVIPDDDQASAMARVKNVTFDLLTDQASGELHERQVSILSALSTLFFIEINHIMRAYVYFERFNPMQDHKFQVSMAGDDEVRLDYEAPTTNGQMSYPDKTRYGMMELF